MNMEMTDMNKIDIIKPTPKRAYECFGPTCSYIRQDAPYPSPIHLDWSSKDLDGDKAKAKEQNSLIDFDILRQKMNMEQTMDINKVPVHKLSLGQDELKEKEPLEVTQSLVPPPLVPMNVEAATKDEVEEEGQMDMEVRLKKKQRNLRCMTEYT